LRLFGDILGFTTGTGNGEFGMTIIDHGNAPEFYADGFARVEVKGSVSRIVFYVEKMLSEDATGREVAISIVVPNEAKEAGARLLVMD
jgi:hypothetical protein